MLFGFTIKAQVLTLSRNAVQLSWQANSSDTIKVFSNTSWSCGSDQSWLSVSSAGGSGDSVIRITATLNPLTTSRTAHLTVSGTGVASQTVTITQAGSPLLSVSSDSLVIGALANSTCSLKITSLPDWTASSNQSWLTLQPSSFVKPLTYAGTYNATGVRIHPTAGSQSFTDLSEELTMLDLVTISKPLAGNYPYEVQITLTNSTLVVGGKNMIVVNIVVINPAGSGMYETDQSGNPTNYFDPSTRTFNLSYYYNTTAPRKIYEVLNGASTTTTVTMTATASENPTSAIRQATITITANGVPDKIVKVTQEASPVLDVSTNSLLLPAAANSSITFNIKSVTNWTVESNVNWLSLVKTSGSNKDTIRVTATENETTEARNAILTVTATGGITRTIQVTQYGKVPASGKWNQYYAGHNYTELSVVDERVFWVSRSSDNTISYTVDGGKTWNTKNLPSNIPGNTAFCAVSGTTAYIACSTGTEIGIYKTTNGADTWTLEPTGFSKNKPTNFYGTSFPDFVYFWDTNNGLAYGDDNEIYVTNNGGTEWTRVSSTVLLNGTGEWSLATQAFYKVTGNTIYILVNNQSSHTRILKSKDKGLTWSPVSTPTNTMSASFDFKDDNNGLCVDYSSIPSKLYSTTNGGQNWELINSTDNLHNLKYIPAQDLYISTNTVNGLLYSADNGKTWAANPSFDFNKAATYNSVISPDGLTTFISGFGYVYSSQNIMGVNTAVEKVSVADSTGLDVTFSNSVELSSANDTANYKLTYTTANPGKSAGNLVKEIKVVSASRDDSNYGIVHLVTREPLPIDTVSVSINNIYDINGFPTINGSVTSVQTLILNFTLSTSILDIGAEANSTNTFSITSNLSWEISSDQSWLSPGVTSGTGNSTITLTATENPENTSRTAIVTVSSAGGTIQTITVTQDGGTTGLTVIENSGISVSPNPASKNLTIKGLNPNSIVTIYDLKGKMLITREMTGNQIDISSLPKGIYTLRVTDKNGIVTKKVIKH